MRFLVFILLAIGFLVTGIVATGTAMTFQWPGYVLLGTAALASVTILFKGQSRGASATCLLAGLGMTVFVVQRAVTSPVTYLAREDAALAVACFCVYALVAVVFGGSKWRMGLFWALVVLVCVNLGFGAYQQVVDMKRWVFEGYMRTYDDRIGGVFNNPNHFAALLALSVPLFLSVAFFGKNHAPSTRLLLSFLSFMCLLGIGASKSRGGLLAVGVGLLVFGLIALPRLWRKFDNRRAHIAMVSVIAMVCAGMGCVGLLNVEMISKRFGTAAFSRASEMNRPLMWRSALEQNAENPLFGTGSRTFYFFSRKYRSSKMHVSVPEADFAHNEYFQVIADYGWVGLFVCGLVMTLHLGYGLRFLQKKRQFEVETRWESEDPGNELALAIGAISGLFAVLAHAFFDFVLHVPVLAMVTVVYLAILAVPGQVQEVRPRQPVSPRFCAGVRVLTRAVCPGMGAALIFFGVVYSRSEWHFEMARLRFESSTNSLVTLDHLRRARELDPQNPFAYSMGGQAYIAAIDSEMPLAVQDAYLRKAEGLLRISNKLYPQDIYGGMAFAEVLDATGQHDEAEIVLNRAREWAPLYGPVMQAQAEHWLRLGNIPLAESYYNEAREAAAFRDWRAARKGLEKIAEWRKIAVKEDRDSEAHLPESLRVGKETIAESEQAAGQ